MSTLQEKLQNCKPAKPHEYSLSFSFVSTTFSERKVPLQKGKIEQFVAPNRYKMISLQHFPRTLVDRGQRKENSFAPGPSQIAGFSGHAQEQR